MAQTLFEYLQADLDTVTEELSGIIETDGKPAKMKTIRVTSDARMRLKHFRDGVDTGFSSISKGGDGGNSGGMEGVGVGGGGSQSAGNAISALLGNPEDEGMQRALLASMGAIGTS